MCFEAWGLGFRVFKVPGFDIQGYGYGVSLLGVLDFGVSEVRDRGVEVWG